MRWINLEKRQPRPEDHASTVLRTVRNKHIIRNRILLDVESKTAKYIDEEGKPLLDTVLLFAEIEWLDESDDEIPYEELEQRYVQLGEAYCDLEQRVDKLLAEQHRNTRHDAADALLNYWSEREYVDLNTDDMLQLIHNLKQRKP